MKKNKTYAWYKKELDRVFSIFIRQRDKGRCFTCSKKSEWKDTDAGHFVKRQHLATRWDERNVNCQCVACNCFRAGQKETYAVKLEKKYGFGILQELEGLKNKGAKFKVAELKELIEHYK